MAVGLFGDWKLVNERLDQARLKQSLLWAKKKCIKPTVGSDFRLDTGYLSVD
jgi:hypothetical protein